MSPDEIGAALSASEGVPERDAEHIKQAMIGDALLREIMANGGRVPRNRAERRKAMSRARRAAQ